MGKKPRARIALVLSLLLSLLCACTAGPAEGQLDPKNPTTVVLWHYYAGDNQVALNEAVSEFNQTLGLEKGIIVDAVAIGELSELEAAVEASAKGVINAMPMPDIFSSYPDVALQIDQYDKVADLNNYLTEEEKQAYIPGFLSDGIFSEDRLLLLPIAKSTELLYVNKTAWDEFAGAENYTEEDLSTWESLYDTAKAYYEWTDAQTPDTPWDGTSLTGLDSVANYIIIGNRQLGVDIIQSSGDGAGEVILNKEVLHRVFNNYYQGMCLGYYGAFEKFRADDLKVGDLISYIGSSSGASYFPTQVTVGNTQTPIDFLALSYPTFQGGSPCAIQQGAGMCIAASTPEKEQGAAEFLKWFTAKDQNIAFAMTTGYMPVQQDAYTSPEFTAAMEDLAQGDAAAQVVAKVYGVALDQIMEQETYAATPFDGSYDVRTMLQSTLMDRTDAGIEKALALKGEGRSEEEILAELDVESEFLLWLETVQDQLDELEIAYTVT